MLWSGFCCNHLNTAFLLHKSNDRPINAIDQKVICAAQFSGDKGMSFKKARPESGRPVLSSFFNSFTPKNLLCYLLQKEAFSF